MKISDLLTESLDNSAEPPENPIVALLREKGIKTWETILSECKKRVDSKKEDIKDEAGDKKDESECKEQAKSKKEEKDDTDQKIETGDKKDIKEETDDHVRCCNLLIIPHTEKLVGN